MKASYNPDVLTCLANLSNDEVFTPPSLANDILNLLPKEVWKDKNIKFLDPATKSGVFLREITKRLMDGLKEEFPNEEERRNHIIQNQVYGIAITELTSLLSKRSLYCSKNAKGKYSICNSFESNDGNINFKRIEHKWRNGSCESCGANQATYQRDATLETHAYQFIHESEVIKMKFDVIIGNPPYQLNDAGAFASASPLYQKFVQQAKRLKPRYLSMIIPARWFSGGKGLDEFRSEMLNDNRLRVLHDYPIGADCFPGTRIAGGVCYFLWDRDNAGPCRVISHRGDKLVSEMTRPLLEKGVDTFIRFNEAVPILRKVLSKDAKSFSEIVSARKPFGLTSDFLKDPSKYNMPKVSDKQIKDGITIIGTLNYKTTKRYAGKAYPIISGKEQFDRYKVFVSQVLDNGFDISKERLRPFVGKPYEICTETFLSVGPFKDEEEAKNVISYMNTKFFHLLMFLKKVSHHVTAKVYEFVPLQDFSEAWNDAMLYKKYGLTKEEVDFIESLIKPME